MCRQLVTGVIHLVLNVPVAMFQAEAARTHSTATTLVALQKRVFGATARPEEDAPVRKHACSAQQYVSALVFGKRDCSLTLATLPSLLRDRFLRPTASLLYGADTRLCSYAAMPPAVGMNGAARASTKIAGAAVIRTATATFGVAVAVRENATGAPDIVLLAPGAPMALLERDFYDSGISAFEGDWAAEEAVALHAAHDACAQFITDVGVDRFPSKVLTGDHFLQIEGVLPFLRLQTPTTAREMALAATSVRAALVDDVAELDVGMARLTKALANARDSATSEAREIRFTTLMWSHGAAKDEAQLAKDMQTSVGGDTLEDALYRCVVTEVGALISLAVDPAKDLASANFEVRAEAVSRVLPELDEEKVADFDDAVTSLKADEARERRLLAATASTDKLALYPPVNLSALFEKPALCYTTQLVDGGTLEQLPGALLPYFERGYHANELLRLKFSSNVLEYVKTLGCLLSRRSAIALVDATLPRERASYVTLCHAEGSHRMRARELPRLIAAPWCLVLVLGCDKEVSVVRRATAQRHGEEPIVFNNAARDEVLKSRPEIEGTAQTLLRQLGAMEERLDELIAASRAEATPRAKASEVAGSKSVKRLRVALDQMKQAMLA